MSFEAYTLDGHKVEVAKTEEGYVLAIRPDHNDYEPAYLTRFDQEGITEMRDALTDVLEQRSIPPVRLERIFADALRDCYSLRIGETTECSCGVRIPPGPAPVEDRHSTHRAQVLVDKLAAANP